MSSLSSFFRDNNRLTWLLRGLVAVLFVFSAVSKLFPIQAFEKQLVDLHIASWCLAPWLARGIIAFELFLGLAFLQNHFFRKFILPATAALLLAFIVHLSWQIISTGNTGNCGCMGQLIPMTPLEAIIKNILTLGLLYLIWRKTPPKPDSLHRYPAAILVVSGLIIMLVFPTSCCCDQPAPVATVAPAVLTPEADTSAAKAAQDQPRAIEKPEKPAEKEKAAVILDPVRDEPAPARVTSEFSTYTVFSGRSVNLDQGRRIVCVYNTTCDHCMDMAKKLTAVAQKHKLPPVYVLFWSEANATGEALQKEVDAFYKFSGSTHPWTSIDVSTFFRKLGKHSSPPRMAVLHEGNITGDFSGDNYSEAALLKAIGK